MIEYNTSKPQLVMREYGRNIQQMIDYCLTIDDREERTDCAYAIADIMARLFNSNSANSSDVRQKVWDHINIMSGFALDIDFPCNVTDQETFHPRPERIPYRKGLNRFRHYGRNLQEMIISVAEMDNNVEKDRLIFLLANQMKKQLVSQNPEIASDLRVFNDIKDISGGRISINPENYRLNDYIGVVNPEQAKKKKKK